MRVRILSKKIFRSLPIEEVLAVIGILWFFAVWLGPYALLAITRMAGVAAGFAAYFLVWGALLVFFYRIYLNSFPKYTTYMFILVFIVQTLIMVVYFLNQVYG